MTKTLAVILHFNTPTLTDNLYQMLEPYQKDDYKLIVFDNGSEPTKKASHSELFVKENCYFGGAVNLLFQYILNHPEYDSLLILNSDLILHGYNWIKTLRKELFDNEYTIVSPCIIQPENRQCHWKNMHNWGAKDTRQVSWIDFQAPLIHRRFIDHLQLFPDLLRYGWGQDILSGIICEDMNWKIGVCDNVCAIHLDSYTVKNNQHLPEMQTYWQNAEKYMFNYFTGIGLMERVNYFRQVNETYSYNI